MAEFILDASVVMAWCFEDEANPYADIILDSLTENTARAPGIWPLEVGNFLVTAERKGRISRADTARFLELLRQLPIAVEFSSEQRLFDTVLNLAREQSLSTYDAAYLDLAMRTNLPIATLDHALREAAVRCQVAVFSAIINP